MDRPLAALVLLVVAAGMIVGLTPYGSATTPDSIRYLDVGQNLRVGEGLVYGNPGTGAELVPFTTYPPLYPAVLSLFLSSDTRPERSSARLAIVTLFLAGFLFYELLRPIERRLALPGAFAFMICQPMLAVYTYAWSESLAIPLLLLGLWLTLRFVEAAQTGRSRRAATLLALLTVSLALIVCCRYICVLFTVLLPLAWLLTAQRRKWLPDFLVAGLGLGAMIGGLALRNLRLTGFLSGSVREPTTKGLTDNVADLLAAFDLQISGEPAILIMAVTLGVVVSVLKYVSDRGPTAGDGAFDVVHSNRLAVLAAVCPAFYFGGLVLLRSSRHFDDIDTRFISLGFPFLLLLLCVGLLRGWQARPRSAPGVAILGVSALLLTPVVAQGFDGFRSAVSGWGLRGSPTFPLTYGMQYVNLNSRSWALQEEARLALDHGRYLDALVVLHRSLAVCEETYPVRRAMAQAYAGVGDVANSLTSTRDCLRLDPERGASDIPAISKPFWDNAELHEEGIDYYRQLTIDLPRAPWLHRNIGALAMRLGDRTLAEEAIKQGQRLEREQTP